VLNGHSPQCRGAGAVSKAVFDQDLERGGNINVVVRRATGDMTGAIATRWCRPGRSRRIWRHTVRDAPEREAQAGQGHSALDAAPADPEQGRYLRLC
jgi:hypothetical protein